MIVPPVDQQVAIARLETQVEHLTESLAELKEANREILAQLKSVQTTLTEARGGWRTLVMLGGLIATAASGITWVATHVKWTN